jgi:hypothetical protein
MTAGNQENERASQAVAAGMSAAAAHQAAAQAQHEASGSATVAEQHSIPDDIAVSWTNADTTAAPTLIPSTPPPVNKPGPHGPPDPAA